MRTHTVQIANTAVPYGIVSIVEALPDRGAVNPDDEVVFNFSGADYVYLPSLVLLASWRKSLPPNISARVDDSRCPSATQNLITNIGFREIIQTGHETPAAQRRSGRLPLRPLTNRFSNDAAVQEVTEIFEETVSHVSDIEAIKTVISELCENALLHSEFASPSYVCARSQEMPDQQRFIEIALCDSGIGFRQSYRSGTNESVKERIKKGADPIQIALEGSNTSIPVPRPGDYRANMGLGLFVTRRIVEENRGQLLIVSQKDAVHCIGAQVRRSIILRKAFPGTFVVVILDPDNPLPLEQIYEEATHSVTGDLSPLQTVPSAHAPVTLPSAEQVEGPLPRAANGGNRVAFGQPALVELRNFGTELLTRDVGLAVRAELSLKLLQSDSVIVDLDGISDITPSVADEAFGKLAVGIGIEKFQRVVILRGGTALAKRLIEFVVKNRVK